MKTSESISAITKALVLAQKSIKHAHKDAKNPHFKNTYATLESVIDASKDALLENEIIVVQAINDKSMVTRLVHSSGEFIESSFELLVDRANMQGLGSAVTYARRYSLAAMLNISQSDDDGNDAVKHASSAINNQAAINGGKAEGVLMSNKVNDLGDYVMTHGSAAVKGKALKAIDHAQLKSSVDYFLNSGKELTGALKVSIHNAQIWLKKHDEKGPKELPSEDIPF